MKKILTILLLMLQSGMNYSSFRITGSWLVTRVFCSPKHNVREIITKAIGSEKKQIDELVYLKTNSGSYKNMLKSINCGIVATVCVDSKSYKDFHSVLATLDKAGADVFIRHYKLGIMHKKHLLLHKADFSHDGTVFKGKICITKSANDTGAGLGKNEESVTITDGPQAFKDVHECFQDTIKRSKSYKKYHQLHENFKKSLED